MSFRGPLADRVAIRELIETYAHGVMTRDADLWGATWTDDAYWALPEFPDLGGFSGKAAIVEGWVGSMKVYGLDNCTKPMIYVATPGSIVVEGDTATAVVYTSEIFDDPTSGKRLRVRGRYDDELVRAGEGWLFQRRTYRTMLVE
ncbi:DUF4440 domain-containing protein [Novosphingobium sp. FSY-8]|uniref:DUF4440 domain-containing protein n=1 Tax=Novosphingobium ovatum TaxID=1908523 RepID=A0ABW9XGW6_9SPHN|nr:nuclear transport factor 2 family protein [Novosphingobium ovatum]NBC37788.1 DUF4440 domain-containing protein [Novosphingobium ovatum]